MPGIQQTSSPDDLVADRESPRSVLNLKVVTLGDKAAGKTSLILRFVEGRFKINSQPTIGALFLCKRGKTGEGLGFKLQIWDTSGDKRFESMAPLYYKTANIVLVCYDVTSRTSFLKTHEWVEKLKQNLNRLKQEGDATVPQMIVVGTKIDLHDLREVPKREAEAFAANNGAAYYETSAKTGENVEGLFEETAARILKESLPPPTKHGFTRAGGKENDDAGSKANSKGSGGSRRSRRSKGSKGNESSVCDSFQWNTVTACNGGDNGGCVIM